MHFCFADEAGCTGNLPSATSNIQPVLVLTGLILDQTCLCSLTHDFLQYKKLFFPKTLSASAHFLDWMKEEIKGSDLRAATCSPDHQKSRHAFTFLLRIIDLLEKNGGRIIGRIWIKPVGAPFNGRAAYTSSIQALCGYFQNYLSFSQDWGMVIADSRDASGNTNVSHSVFTQKYASSGDRYDRLLETPVFGHSNNHVGLQLADLMCSAIVFPLAVYTYCTGYVTNVPVRPGYVNMQKLLGKRLKELQYRYLDKENRWQGGLVVSDPVGNRSGGLLFGK